MTEIVVQAEIAGIATVAFTENVDSDGYDAFLDRCTKAVSRVRAQQELIEALIDLQARRDTLTQYPDLVSGCRRKRLEERAHMVAGFEQAHATAGRRVDFAPSKAQREGLVQFDAQTVAELKKLADDKARIEREIPLCEARVARQRAIIAGRERSEVIGPGALASAEAAD